MKDKKTAGLDELANAFNAFVDGIAERGKAKAGEKTIIDSMLPAAETLIKASEKDDNIPDAFCSAYKAAEEGLEKTKSMKSVHGKAFYHSERSKGTIDPGAAAGVLFLKGFAEYINQR